MAIAEPPARTRYPSDMIVEARARLLERAEKLGDPEARERLLSEVPENAATLLLARELTSYPLR